MYPVAPDSFSRSDRFIDISFFAAQRATGCKRCVLLLNDKILMLLGMALALSRETGLISELRFRRLGPLRRLPKNFIFRLIILGRSPIRPETVSQLPNP